MEHPTTYATHTEIVAANKLIIVRTYSIQERLTLAGQPYPLPSLNTCDVL